MRSRSVVWTPKCVSCAVRAIPGLYRQKKKASRCSATPSSQEQPGCKPLLCAQLVGQRRLGGTLDGDRPGLLLLGDLALQLDGQQAIGELGAHDLDVIGELEAALEV